MIAATAMLPTESGGKYLVQLCKHFAHRIDVSYSDAWGECRFSCGTAVLRADGDGLHIRTTAPDEAQLAETKSVIESHLIRFAFREKLQSLDWVEAAAD
ncbi:DUF2218 domain-containing protein [Metarhizobium album]|uniref:DUF2218 domain-containing protein n=1 Tax=Metarhizobium album TaxID=2182425 RepID=A0A2U2DNK9_9HYPH|nr:DUF2218 domain-containing protein [Rhizobium album]PWE54819.1 DUF2218 domain-containing protein [Rhizobium album]